MDKIFGKGQKSGFMIPQNKIDQLIKNENLLTTCQQKQVLEALQSGSGVVIKPTKSQSRGFQGTLLLNALTGKGLHVDRGVTTNTIPVHVPKGGKMHMHSCLHLFLIMEKNPVGMEVKKKRSQKKKRKRASIRQKSPFNINPNSWNNTIKFITKPLSNHDLYQWINKLKIKHFRGIFCRDNLPKKIQRLETGIINLAAST